MKKRLIALSIIAITLMATGCKKDTNVFSINATINNFSSDAKVYIDAVNFSCWHSGDAIMINDITGTIDVLSNNNRKGTIASTTEPTAEDDNYYAIYPANAVTSTTVGPTATIHLPSMQKCIIGDDGKQVINAIMGAQGTTKLNFYNLCALLKVKLPASLNVTDIYVTTFTNDGDTRVKTNQRLWGNGTVRFNGEGVRPTLSPLSRSEELVNGVVDGGDTIYLHVVDHPSDGIYYITVPEVRGVNYEVRVNYIVAGSNQNYFYQVIKRQSGNQNQLLANQIGVVDFGSITQPEPTNPDPNDFIPGIYSVSETKKVNFAKGNMVYSFPGSVAPADADNYNWSFHTTQYTTAGIVYADEDENIPNTTSEYSKYSVNMGVFPNNNNYSSATFYDWGNYIDITKWFTLSLAEWQYLLYTRPVSFARFAKVQVDGANGLLLFPDEFLWPNDNLTQPTSLNNASAAFSQINYTPAQFSKLEEAGCVFLRANGHITHNGGTNIEDEGAGLYWTSDCTFAHGNTSNSFIYFDNSYISPTHDLPHENVQGGFGLCVRLARLAE